jgi:S1-C subfamily serine protease
LGFVPGQLGGRVVVARVEPFSAALRAGIRTGQVIVSVNRVEVSDLAELEAALRRVEGDVLSLIIEDPGIGRTIVNYRI